MEKMFIAPVAPRKRNHTSITGPKALPMRLVPACCTAKSDAMMQSVMMMTPVWRPPRSLSIIAILRSPSTAEVTVTAGVSTPSASSAAPTSIAGTMSHLPQLRTSE